MQRVILTFFLLCLGTIPTIGYAQERALDSLKGEIFSIEDSIKIDKASLFIKDLRVNEKFDEGVHYANLFIELSKDINYSIGTGELFTRKGNIYNVTDQFENALAAYDSALYYLKTSKELLQLANIYNNQSVVYGKSGNFEGSLMSVQKASEIYKMLNNHRNYSNSLINIGNIYFTYENYDLAEKFYIESILIAEEMELTDGLSRAINNLTDVYIVRKQYDRALKNAKKGLKVSAESNSFYSVASANHDLGVIYLELEEYDKARACLLKALGTRAKENYDSRSARVFNTLAKVEFKANNFLKSKEHIKQARKIAKSVNLQEVLIKNYRICAEMDASMGDFEEAYNCHLEYLQLSDRMLADIKSRNINSIQEKFEFNKEQEALLLAQQKESIANQAELENQRRFNYFLWTAFIAVSLVLFFMLRNVSQRKKYNKKLSVQAKELKSSNATKDKLFSIIAHDLRNSILSMNEALNMVKSRDLTVEELEELLPSLTEKSNQTSSLLTNLLHWSSTQLNALNPERDYFDFKDIVTEKLEYISSSAAEKGVTLKNELFHLDVYADANMMKVVIQNLLSNAVKFCDHGDEIRVYAEHNKKRALIYVSDTGMGISKKQLKNLFTAKLVSTYGTKNEKGIGLGLPTCKELVELNGGKISVESTINEGSIFCLELPLQKPTIKSQFKKKSS